MLSGTPAQSERMMAAVMQMTKIDVAALKHAYESAKAA